MAIGFIFLFLKNHGIAILLKEEELDNNISKMRKKYIFYS